MAIPITFNEQTLSIEPGQCLLDIAEENNLNIPSSCRSGNCQTCLVKVENGDIPTESQQGLHANQKQQGYALACQLKPASPLTIRSRDFSQLHNATVIHKDIITKDILLLRVEASLSWRAGQFITIWKDNNVGRPYSIASLPHDGYLEFYIKRHNQGTVSEWLFHDINVGESLKISDATGNCFYSESMSQKPILLIGSGTGLAPLIGIIKDAVMQGHSKDINLFLSNKHFDQTYLHTELEAISTANPCFRFWSILQNEEQSGFITGDLKSIVSKQHSDLKNWCVFLCGAPSLVQSLQKQCFLSGASLSDIFSDPFITAKK